MTWTKTKTGVVTGAVVILVVGTIMVVARKSSSSPDAKSQQARITAAINQIKQVNTTLPERQVQAKMLIFSAMIQKKIPEAANWCETLNAGGKLWPTTPTNTVFAINAKMAGRAYSRSLPSDTVVFFEASNPGWNQAGGPELLAERAEGVAVAFADGRALIVPPAEVARLRWTP